MTGTQTTTFLEPERIVRYFGLEKGDHVADFGAGHGFFTIPMARAVGGDGMIYALDVQKSVLDIIRARAKLEHLLNIEPLWADLDESGGSRLKDKYLDFVLIASTLFQTEKKEIMLKEAYRVLRSGGRLAIIEWEQNSNLGPPRETKVKKDLVKNLALAAGFQLDREFEAGSHHYGLLFKKQ